MSNDRILAQEYQMISAGPLYLKVVTQKMSVCLCARTHSTCDLVHIFTEDLWPVYQPFIHKNLWLVGFLVASSTRVPT